MKIRTAFIITMIIFGLVLLIIAASVVLTIQQLERLDMQEETAISIERGASELSYLSNDYLLYREDQQHIRWETKWSSISHDLAQLEPSSPEQQVIVDNIKDNHERLKAVFDNVALAFQDTTQTSGAESIQSFTQVSWSRMAVQNQGIAFDASQLSQVIRDRKDQLRQTNSLLIFVLLGSFSAYFVTNYLIVQRRLLKSIADLHSGTKVIGSGNLDFALEVKHDDEIGELSRAFNLMTTDLKGVTASKTELEREVVERKRAEEEVRANQLILKGINEILDKALTSETEEGLGQVCLSVAEKVTQSKFGFIDEIGPNGFLHDIAISNPGWDLCTMYDKSGHRRPPADFKLHGIYGHVFLHGKSFITNDPPSHPDSIGIPEGHPPLNAFLGTPLIQNGKTIGVIAMGNREGGYTQEQMEALERLAPIIMQAFERKRAEEELAAHHVLIREQNERLEAINEELRISTDELIEIQHTLTESKSLSDALNDINTTLNSTFDVAEVMQRVLAEGADAMGSESSSIILREEDRWFVRYVNNMPQGLIGMRLTKEQGRHLEYIAKTKEVLFIKDTSTDERVNREFIQKVVGIQSAAVLPLLVKGEVAGALSFSYRSTKGTFDEAQIDFANKLAASISLALENARLYEAERQIANTLQGALQTMPEHIDGIEFGSLYRSATETARVGGDFYDIFELEHDRVGIVIGDVSGKGIEAATLTALARNTIRAYAHEEGLPSEILKKTNNAILRTVSAGNFITLFLGIVDMRSGELLYCSAGHPSVLLKRKAAGVELLEVSSPVIGAFAELDYVDSRATIKEGDILFLYTDGITEARCHGGLIGEERLVEFIKRLEPMPAKAMPQAVFSSIMECTGGMLADDVALLSVSLVGIKLSPHS